MRKLVVALKVALLLSMLSILPVLANTSSSAVLTFFDMSEVGSAELKRHENSVTLHVNTTGLEAGAAYTVWWVIFNNPDDCVGGCGEDDLGNVDVNGTVLFAAGHVVGNNGEANFSSHLNEGDISGLQSDLPEFPGNSDGLVDASGAEIHIVVRNHGQPIPGHVHEQISTFGGGCDIDTGGQLPIGEGNVCVDEQFAVFAP